MKRTFLLSTCFVALIGLLCSCDPKEDDGQQLAAIETGLPSSITAFHATVEGTINDGEIISDINRGRCNFGVLYVLDSAVEGSAEGMFQGYLDTGSMQGLTNGACNSIQPDGKFYVTISNLEPEQKIWYCAYAVRQDGTRIIGTTQNATTTQFMADLTTGEAKKISYFTASLNGTVSMDDIDMKRCSFGFVLGTQPNVTEKDGIVANIKESIDKTGIVKHEANNLKANTKYYYRLFAKDNVTGLYSFGNEMSMTTQDPSDLAVDLGLSVKWASCDLGATDYKEMGLLFSWGSVEPITYGSAVNYEYNNLGNNIAGTQYDAATLMLGEKWRMPTEDEVNELIQSCSIGRDGYELRDTTFLGAGSISISIEYYVAAVFTGKNGNKMRITTFVKSSKPENGTYARQRSPYRWLGNQAGGTTAKVMNHYCLFLSEEDKQAGYDRYTELIETADKAWAFPIRPVCEY